MNKKDKLCCISINDCKRKEPKYSRKGISSENAWKKYKNSKNSKENIKNNCNG